MIRPDAVIALDPALIGSGIGPAPGDPASVRQAPGGLPPRLTPQFHPAARAEKAGVEGIAHLAKRQN